MLQRIFPHGLEINTHEKLIQSMVEAGMGIDRILDILQEAGCQCDNISYGDLLDVIESTKSFTHSSQKQVWYKHLTEEEYFMMLAEELNNLTN